MLPFVGDTAEGLFRMEAGGEEEAGGDFDAELGQFFDLPGVQTVVGLLLDQVRRLTGGHFAHELEKLGRKLIVRVLEFDVLLAHTTLDGHRHRHRHRH